MADPWGGASNSPSNNNDQSQWITSQNFESGLLPTQHISQPNQFAVNSGIPQQLRMQQGAYATWEMQPSWTQVQQQQQPSMLTPHQQIYHHHPQQQQQQQQQHGPQAWRAQFQPVDAKGGNFSGRNNVNNNNNNFNNRGNTNTNNSNNNNNNNNNNNSGGTAPKIPVHKHMLEKQRLIDERKAQLDAAGPEMLELSQAVFDFARKGEVEELRVFLKEHPDVDVDLYWNRRGNTALHKAASYGHIEIIDMLIAHGANIDKQASADGWTALHEAAKNGHSELARELIVKHKASRGIKNKKKLTAHELATKWKQYGVMDFFEKEAPLLPPSALELSLSHQVFKLTGTNSVAHIRELVAVSPAVDVNVYLSLEGTSCLHVAARKGFPDATRLLLELKANVNAQDNDGNAALHLAASGNHVECLDALVREGAELTLTNYSKETAPMVAERCNNRSAIAFFRNVAPKLVRNNRSMCLSQTVFELTRSEDVDGLKEFFAEHGKEVDVNLYCNDRGWTSVACAARYGYEEIVELLMEWKADINQIDNGGWTSLHCAARNGHNDVAQLLISGKANVNQEDNAGWTPLHYGAHNGRGDIVRLLVLDNNANIHVRDRKRRTPRDCALAHDKMSIVQFFDEELPKVRPDLAAPQPHQQQQPQQQKGGNRKGRDVISRQSRRGRGRARSGSGGRNSNSNDSKSPRSSSGSGEYFKAALNNNKSSNRRRSMQPNNKPAN